MSRIVDKVFDASKKIIRSVFKGSPNLFTSVDLNRQIEAIKYQLDRLDEKTGVISDMTITHSLSAGTLTVQPSLTYLVTKGCSFSPQESSLSINLTSSAPIAYLCLIAEEDTVTYETDFSHEISGAKFEDGTSMPAANQIVYKNEQLILTHALSNLQNLVGVMAAFILSDSGNLIVKSNVIENKESLAMRDKGSIVDFKADATGKVTNGKSYDEAFSIVENRFTNIGSNWEYLVKEEAGVKRPTDNTFRVQNGILYVNIPEKELSFSGGTSEVVKIGEFPDSVRQQIITFFVKMGFATLGSFMAEDAQFDGASPESVFIPYGDFGNGTAFSNYLKVSETSNYYPSMGNFKISVILSYKNNSGQYSLSDVYIGAYCYGGMFLGADNKESQAYGGSAFIDISLAARGGKLYIPRMIGAVPLFGPV